MFSIVFLLQNLTSIVKFNIYHFFKCRYGSEDKLATLMGVMQALVSVVQDGKNTIRLA